MTSPEGDGPGHGPDGGGEPSDSAGSGHAPSTSPAGPFGEAGAGGPLETHAVADFHAALDVFKTLLGQLVPSGLLGAFAIMAAAAVLAHSPLWVAQYLDHRARAQVLAGDFNTFASLGLVSSALKIMSAALVVLVFTARLGLARPMRALVLGGGPQTQRVGDLLRLALDRFAPNLGIVLLYGVAISVGMGLCIVPGIVAAVVLYPALYLVATEREIGDALTLAVDWISRHTGALLGTLGLLAAIGVVLFCCSCGTLGVFVSPRDPGTALLVMPAITLVNEAISALTLTFLASGCIAADQAESTRSRRDAQSGPF